MTIATILAAAPTVLGQTDADQEAERRFLQAVHEYTTLCRELERQLPPLRVTLDVQEIERAVEARAAAIRRARARAKAGDIFNAGVAGVFRARIRGGFADRGLDAASLIVEMDEDGERWEPAEVNGRFSWGAAAGTPAHVLIALPALPRELQYRFVGPDLVLVDIVANVIIDVLPDALDVKLHHRAR